MEIERKKDNRMFITERTPSYRDFRPRALVLYRELLEFIKKSGKYDLLSVKKRV
jgi:hypothetical protein